MRGRLSIACCGSIAIERMSSYACWRSSGRPLIDAVLGEPLVRDLGGVVVDLLPHFLDRSERRCPNVRVPQSVVVRVSSSGPARWLTYDWATSAPKAFFASSNPLRIARSSARSTNSR